jgi:hypothetical protein
MDEILEDKIIEVLGHERLTVRDVVEGLESEGYYKSPNVVARGLRIMWTAKQLDRDKIGYGDLVYWNPSALEE